MSDSSTDHNRSLSKQTDDEIRQRARALHDRPWVIEISDDAEVIRPDDGSDCVSIAAVIRLGPED